jgi:RNA polymerase sigma-70 factor (ECF subfamily)
LTAKTSARDETDRGAQSDEIDERWRSSLVGMNATSTSARTRERKLLEVARRGDDDAFRRLVEPYQSELHAHCYRMLGSLHDADDALQDALLRAWRGLEKFEHRSSLRTWLYRITTNACLDVISRRPKRVLPTDHGPAAGRDDGLADPLTESVWIEPYPDQQHGVEDGYAAPEARFELRESVELAFIAALQHLPASQRAVLILRDVLGFSARESADLLGRTVPSVNGALRRGRRAAAERLPDRTQQITLRELGDGRISELARRYIDAWERSDIDAILAVLIEDATFTMPPLPTWYRGRDAIAAFLARDALQDQWRLLPARANGQLAFGCYAWDVEQRRHTALSLDVLTLDGPRASEVTSFVTPHSRGPARERFASDVLGRFGLPARLD